jgi:hypothetical protein
MKRKPGLTRAGDSPMLQQIALPLTPAQERLLDASVEIGTNPATADNAAYLHAVLCQVGMPRKRVTETKFLRRSGNAALQITAGDLWDGQNFVPQPIPFGPKPRLILINLTTAAILTGNPVIDVGRSAREFMARVGLDTQGSEYRSLRRKVAALSVCRMHLGFSIGTRVVNIPNLQPVKAFDLWLVPDQNQQMLWPCMVEPSKDYFDNVREHAVPLDERTIRFYP